MKKLTLFLISLTFTYVLMAQTYVNPFENSTNSFNSKDVQFLWSQENNTAVLNQQYFSYGWYDAFGTEPTGQFDAKTNIQELGDDGLGGSYRLVSVAADLTGDGIDQSVNLIEESGYWAIHVSNHSTSWNEENFDYDYVNEGISPIIFETCGSEGTFINMPRMISGDFDGDDQDEIALAWKQVDTNLIRIQIYDSHGTNILSQEAAIEDETTLVDLSNRDSYNLGSGDFNNDGKVDLAISGLRNNPGGIVDRSVFVKIYEVGDDSSIIIPKGSTVLNSDITSGVDDDIQAIMTAVNGLSQKQGLNSEESNYLIASFIYNFENFNNSVDNSFVYQYEVSSDLMDISILDSYSSYETYEYQYQYGIYEGNFDGEYPNEFMVNIHAGGLIFSTVDEIMNFASSDGAGSVLSSNFSRDVFEIADIDSDGVDEIVVFDLIEGDDEITYNLRVYGVESGSNYDFDLQSLQSWTEDYNYNQIALGFSIGNFDGSDLMLGEGTSYECEYKIPILNLGAVPIHFDIINEEVWDINECFLGDCNALTQYKQTESVENSIGLTVNSDWSVSAEGSAEGFGMKASIEGKYGEKFSDTEGSSTSVTIENVISAVKDDALMSYNIPVQLWEYPVLSPLGDTIDYVIAAFPDQSGENITINVQSSKTMLNYLPNYEVGNVMSYPNYGTYEEYPDFPEFVPNGQNPIILSGGDYQYDISSTIGNTQTITYEESFNSSSSSQWDAGVSAEAEASGFGFGVKVKGEYNMGELSMSNQTVSTTQEFTFDVGSVFGSDSEYSYKVTPRIYWGDHGATVVTYDVETLTAGDTFWSDVYNTNSDPTIVLPWKHDPIHSNLDSLDSKVNRTKSMYFSNYSPAIGEQVTVNLRVFNYSLAATGSPVEVSFYLGHPNEGNIIENLMGETVFSMNEQLGSRGRDVLSMTFEFTEEMFDESFLKIFAEIDPSNLITEVHEDNNIGWSQLGYFCNDPESTTSIEENLTGVDPDRFKIFPNPANDQINIELPVSIGKNIRLNIFDVFGRKVKPQSNNFYAASDYKIIKNISDLTTGVYVVMLEIDGFKMSRQFVKL